MYKEINVHLKWVEYTLGLIDKAILVSTHQAAIKNLEKHRGEELSQEHYAKMSTNLSSHFESRKSFLEEKEEIADESFEEASIKAAHDIIENHPVRIGDHAAFEVFAGFLPLKISMIEGMIASLTAFKLEVERVLKQKIEFSTKFFDAFRIFYAITPGIMILTNQGLDRLIRKEFYCEQTQRLIDALKRCYNAYLELHSSLTA